MKTRPFENRIIIIGADHHNTLAAIRAFGKENCEIAVVIHGQHLEKKQIQVFSSRYVDQAQTYLIDNDVDALLEVLNHYGNAEKKDVLFPTSDFAEYTIDSNYESLSKRFFLPGFIGSPGKVCRMMDKWNQYLFARENDIPMATTFLIQTEKPIIPPDLSFPCIVKPKVSAFGSKDEIIRCENKDELLTVLNHYRQCGHSDGLVQEFLQKKYEVCSFGSISSGNVVGGAILKLREQLESGQSYSVFITDNSSDDGDVSDELDIDGVSTDEFRCFQQINRRVLKLLQDSLYNGQYDIEYFICKNGIFLNEINYRHSGNGFAFVNKQMNIPFDWATSMLGLSDGSVQNAKVRVGDYVMVELLDSIYIKRRTLSIHKWLQEIKKANSFAVFNRNDLKATFRIYKDFIIGFLKRNIKKIFR